MGSHVKWWAGGVSSCSADGSEPFAPCAAQTQDLFLAVGTSIALPFTTAVAARERQTLTSRHTVFNLIRERVRTQSW
jgi:hypothetical protein